MKASFARLSSTKEPGGVAKPRQCRQAISKHTRLARTVPILVQQRATIATTLLHALVPACQRRLSGMST